MSAWPSRSRMSPTRACPAPPSSQRPYRPGTTVSGLTAKVTRSASTARISVSSGRRWSGVRTLRAKYVAVASDPLTAAPTTAALLAPATHSTFCVVEKSVRVGGTPAIVSGEPHGPRPPPRTLGGTEGGAGRGPGGVGRLADVKQPVDLPVSPMLAKAVKEVPAADSVAGGLVYEPKWDGFRCLVLRDGDEVELASRGSRRSRRTSRRWSRTSGACSRRSASSTRRSWSAAAPVGRSGSSGSTCPNASTRRSRGSASSPRRRRPSSSASTCSPLATSR